MVLVLVMWRNQAQDSHLLLVSGHANVCVFVREPFSIYTVCILQPRSIFWFTLSTYDHLLDNVCSRYYDWLLKKTVATVRSQIIHEWINKDINLLYFYRLIVLLEWKVLFSACFIPRNMKAKYINIVQVISEDPDEGISYPDLDSHWF